MSVPALEISGLRKAYGGLVVTGGVSMTLPRGARHALIGPNGAGKSTLVGLISGVIRPDAGRILLDGEDISRKLPAARTRKGLVRTFQVTSLFPKLTVFENVLLAIQEQSGTSLRLWRPAASYRPQLETARDIAASLGLSADIDRPVMEMSYGQQRLVEIALAMALKPRVLLLDEPAAGIPGTEIHLLMEAIDRLSDEIAILMIEHDMEIVKRFANSVTVLVEGRVLLTAPTARVLESDEVRAVYLGGQRKVRARMQAHA